MCVSIQNVDVHPGPSPHMATKTYQKTFFGRTMANTWKATEKLKKNPKTKKQNKQKTAKQKKRPPENIKTKITPKTNKTNPQKIFKVKK